MKKIARLVLVLALLCGMASAEAPGFQPLHISLWTDPLSGYEWTCEYDDNGVLAAPMEEYNAAEQTAGGSHDFYFGVLESGRAEIIFNYAANWDVSVPVRSVICSVTVDEGGKASVCRAESYSDDHTIVVTLPSNPTTGWNWAYQEDTSGVLSLLSEEYVPVNDQLEGAGGTLTYQFRAEKSGQAVLLFNYSNLWEHSAAAAQTYSVVVTANDAMEISLTADQQ